MRLAEIGF